MSAMRNFGTLDSNVVPRFPLSTVIGWMPKLGYNPCMLL